MNVYSLFKEIGNKDKAGSVLNRRERYRLLRKADILQAAEHVFALKGYHQATMQDIARQAQYATGTVYLYFTDKNALYFSIVEEKMNDLLSILIDKTAGVKDIRKKIEIVIFENLSFFERNQDFFRIFISEETKLSISSKIAKSSVASRHREFFIELVKMAQAENMIRKDIAASQISGIFESIVTSVIFNWLQTNVTQKEDLKSMSGVIREMFFHGVSKE